MVLEPEPSGVDSKKLPEDVEHVLRVVAFLEHEAQQQAHSLLLPVWLTHMTTLSQELLAMVDSLVLPMDNLFAESSKANVSAKNHFTVFYYVVFDHIQVGIYERILFWSSPRIEE